MDMDIRAAIARLMEHRDLSEEETEAVMRQIMDGQATPAQIGGFLVALRLKGETVEEIAGAARTMRRYAIPVDVGSDVVDTCGTGGDMRGTFNISTTAAFIAAGAGVRVAKHGNRAMSGAVGGADVLEALGVRIDLPADRAAECIDEVGIAFLFAPTFHGAMRHAAAPRRELGIRTVFNLLGPLANPAGAGCQLLGVFSRAWVKPLAEALQRLGSRRVMVVHGEDGLDEITLTAPTAVAELRDGEVHAYTLAPDAFGLPRCRVDELRGGDTAQNAEILRAVLEERAAPAQTNVALVNAAAVIHLAGAATTVVEGIERARESIRSGAAREKLARLVEWGGR